MPTTCFFCLFGSATESRSAFAIIDRTSNAVIGSSRYDEWQPESSSVAIGYTFAASNIRFQKTVLKIGAMLDHHGKKHIAGQTLDYHFYKIDKVNWLARNSSLKGQINLNN